jgi:two-component system, NtrC family, sensor kinase
MLENAVRICDAKFGNIYRWDGEALHLLASHNTPPAFVEMRTRLPYRPSPEAPVGRMVATKSVVHVTDLKEEKGYIERSIPATVAAVELGGVRTFLSVPMLTEGELIGAILLNRPEVRPFSEKEIGLVTTSPLKLSSPSRTPGF